MKFSIIIPTYNSEANIYTALSSVVSQTYSDFEAIIIDDGSTDNTKSTCEKFLTKDSRFKYFYQANSGVSAARNLGIKESSGDYIVFLDSDDSYEPNYLYEFEQLIRTDANCNNFWINYNEININRTKIIANDHILNSDVAVCDRNAVYILPALWNKAFKRSIVHDNAIFMREDLSLGEDFIFNYEYLTLSGRKILHSNRCLYNYTVDNSTSLDGKYRADLLEIFRVLEKTMLEHYKKWCVQSERYKQYYEYVFYNRIKVLYNTYRVESKLSRREQRNYNNKLLKSKEFVESLKYVKSDINPLYRFAYKLGSWRLIQLLDFLAKIKSKILKGVH